MLARILAYIVAAVLTYYGASLIQTLFHRLFGHTRRIARLYDVHVRGHHAQYSGSMLSDVWIPTDQHTLWYYGLVFVPISAMTLLLLPFDLFAVHLGSLAFAIWWHIYLHRQYHVRRAWLSRFTWFQRKRRLHVVHHRHPHKNYAIVEYCWDRLLGTFHDDDPPCRRSIPNAS